MGERLKNAIAISLLPQVLLVQWIGQHPEWVETYYSRGFYPIWSGTYRLLLGWFPFSVGDVLYALLIFWFIYFVIKNRDRLLANWKLLLRNIAMVLSVAYFTFHWSWGLNYYRQPIAEVFELEAKDDMRRLIQTTEALIHKTNELQYSITSDSTEMVRVPYDQEEIFKKTILAYEDLASHYPRLTYERPSLKKSLFSTLLSYMGYGGYLNPFTHESQVNSKIPVFRFPVICGHEVGHQVGYSAENEVNFIGYLVMASTSDPYLQYSAYAYALSHCLSTLSTKDEPLFELMYEKVNQGTQKNYEEYKAFWESYKNPMEPVFKSIFNAFLKANNQSEGIRSYSLVVPLIVGYHEKYPIDIR